MTRAVDDQLIIRDIRVDEDGKVLLSPRSIDDIAEKIIEKLKSEREAS